MEMSDIMALSERVKCALNNRLNEANTRPSLIRPFLHALGYEVFNHNEVANEYTTDFGTNREKKETLVFLKMVNLLS